MEASPAASTAAQKPASKGGSGRSTPNVKQFNLSTPQEKGAAKTSKQKKDGRAPKAQVPALVAAPPQQAVGGPPRAGSSVSNQPNTQAPTDYFVPDTVPPHLRALYQAHGRGDVDRGHFDRLAQQISRQFANSPVRNERAPLFVRGPLASSNPAMTNGVQPGMVLEHKPRAVVEVVIPSQNGSNGASARKGKCPTCSEAHRPSMCPKLQKERHVRLALDGLGQWSSDPQELAAERKALKDKLKAFR